VGGPGRNGGGIPRQGSARRRSVEAPRRSPPLTIDDLDALLLLCSGALSLDMWSLTCAKR
jgi:hypothetical protein